MTDIELCILDFSLGSSKACHLPYYLYLYQIAGLNLSFKFKVTPTGIICKSLNDILWEMSNNGLLILDNGSITPTDKGIDLYSNSARNLEDWERIEQIGRLLGSLTKTEMFFICIVDMFVYGTYAQKGVEGLLKDRDTLKQQIKCLVKEYTDVDFDAALNFTKNIRR